MPWLSPIFLAIIFFATLVRSTFGFGEGLVALPLLALMMPVSIAAPVVVMLSVSIAAVVVVQDWRHIHVSSAAWLLVPSFCGIPLGVLLLASPNQPLVKGLLGLVVVLFAGYSLMCRNPPRLEQDHRSGMLLAGFVAGILGGAYGLNGPPLVVYGAMRRWSPAHFRATLQAYFLPASLVGIMGFAIAGLLAREVFYLYGISLIAAVPAIFIGRALNRRLRSDTFLRAVYGGLIGLGALLLAQAFIVVH